jgi:ubiquitin-conjugating enzyme E2 H
MSSSNKRVLRDIELLKDDENINIEVININTIECDIVGPNDTPYQKGKWRIIISFPNNYPFKSPSVGFKNKIFHPNVDEKSGSICLNVLNQCWTPIYTVSHIVNTFIPQLLAYPNAEDPLNIEAAQMLINSPEEFNRYVKSSIYCNQLQ